MPTIMASVSEELKAKIKNKADSMGIRMSDYVRMVLIQADNFNVGLRFEPNNAPVTNTTETSQM